MSLFAKRVSALEIVAEGLRNEEGELIESIVSGDTVVITAGDRIISISVKPRPLGTGNYSKGNPLEIEVTEKAGTKIKPLFKVGL